MNTNESKMVRGEGPDLDLLASLTVLESVSKPKHLGQGKPGPAWTLGGGEKKRHFLWGIFRLSSRWDISLVSRFLFRMGPRE